MGLSNNVRLPVRAPGVISREIGTEVIVLDPTSNTAHSLAGPVAAVWRATGGAAPPELNAAQTDAAIAQLVELGLVQAQGLSRRDLLARGGMVVAGAGVASVLLPQAVAAASPVFGFSKATSGAVSILIPAGVEKVAFTIMGGGGGGAIAAGPGGGGGAPALYSGTFTLTNPKSGSGVTLSGWVGGGGRSGATTGAGGAGAATPIKNFVGAGGAGSAGGAGGGGAATFLASPSGDLLLVAGGGGGGGQGFETYTRQGGAGGKADDDGAAGATNLVIGGGGGGSAGGASFGGSGGTSYGTVGSPGNPPTGATRVGTGGAGGSATNQPAGGGGAGGYSGGGGGGAGIDFKIGVSLIHSAGGGGGGGSSAKVDNTALNFKTTGYTAGTASGAQAGVDGTPGSISLSQGS